MPATKQLERCLAAVNAHNPFVNALTSVRPTETLMREAAACSQRLSKNESLSKVDGAVVAVKDNICTADLPTTCSSNILREYRSPYAATVVTRLEKAGALVLGKTNMDEFGMGSHSTHSAFGSVKRPHRSGQKEERSAGGSSGGSAAAVAAGMCDGSLGTDTGGSVRLPAAYCGIYGLKPSYGMVSRWGVVAYSNSLDTVGVLAKDTSTVAAIYDTISGPDHHDPTCLKASTRSRIAQLVSERRRKSERLRIGIPLEYNIDGLAPPVLKAWKQTIRKIEQLGLEVTTVNLPHTQHALSTYYILAASEASSNLAKYDGLRYGTRHEEDWSDDGILFANTRYTGFGDEVRRRILLGTYSLSASAMDNYFLQAQRVRKLIRNDFNSVFALGHPLLKSEGEGEGGVDVLLAPTSLSRAPLLADVLGEKSPLDSYVNDVLTVPASLAGIPAMSVPVKPEGEDEAVGMQLLAQYGDEDALFKLSKLLEEAK